MVQPSTETVTLASQLVESLVSSGLPRDFARLYSHHTRLRENQPGLMSWSQTESNSRLDDVIRLLEAASVQRQTDDTQWQKTVLRAGEILEWLPIRDTNSEEISTRLLAAACYQLAGYPARALGLLREEGSQDTESIILIALLKADFVQLLQLIGAYWSQTILEIQRVSQSDNQDTHTIQTMIVRETVSALGLLCAVMRWGNDSRIQKALNKLTAVSKVVLHGRNPYSWILSKLCAEVAATYVENSMRQHLDILLQNMSSDGRAVFERYLRYGFHLGQSMAWPSQVRGIQALSRQESFALCTPTGSGKTRVAELAILQSLFPTNTNPERSSSQAPLVMYLVPSRALATEVEAKLSRVFLRQSTPHYQQVTVTGLYGGTDWGPTDAWLTADEKTILICTYEKAEALMKFLGSFFLPRTTLIVVDEVHTVQFSGTNESLQKSENRALRLESLGARLFSHLQRARCRIVALSAVASAENALARWVTHQDNATPIKTTYKSTRQLIGRLECLPGRGFEIRYDLLDGVPLSFGSEESAEQPYVPSPFPRHPSAPNFTRNNPSFTKRSRPYLFWAAMNLAAPNDRGQQRAVLISISQGISGYAKDFLELLNRTWVTEQLPNFFQEPVDQDKQNIWRKCLMSCEDYYTISSREYKLLTKGVVIHHGKMPGLMARLLVEVIEEKIVHLVMATSTLSEGVNLPFETVLIPNLQRWGVNENSQIDFSSSEFKNLVGRAGRPGFGTEGRSLVLLPDQPNRSESNIRNLYFSLINRLQDQQSDTEGEAISPIAELITHLETQWLRVLPNSSNEDFLTWLEQTAPITAQPSNESEENAIESLDSLDNVLLAAIVEIEQISAREMEPNELEAELRRLWQQTYAYYASQNQAQLQELFVHRGRALKSTIYPNYGERKRLYKTSLPPISGNQLLTLYRRIRDHLETGGDYLSRQEDEQFTYIRDTIRLIGEVNTFSISNLNGRGRGAETSWEVILRWWLCHRRAPLQPRETQISDWHNFVSKNFSYRFNWGLGSILALAIDEAFGDMSLEPSSLENWPRTGLPWIVFWMKELIVWGTVDPVAAYLLARIDDVTTRTQAEELSQVYYQSVSNLEPNDRLNPIAIRSWAQQLFAPIRQQSIELRPSREIPVSLLRDFSRASKHKWRVIPVEVEEEIHWLDPAGFRLASCQIPENWQEDYLCKYDFELDSNRGIVTSEVYL